MHKEGTTETVLVGLIRGSSGSIWEKLWSYVEIISDEIGNKFIWDELRERRIRKRDFFLVASDIRREVGWFFGEKVQRLAVSFSTVNWLLYFVGSFRGGRQKTRRIFPRTIYGKITTSLISNFHYNDITIHTNRNKTLCVVPNLGPHQVKVTIVDKRWDNHNFFW